MCSAFAGRMTPAQIRKRDSELREYIESIVAGMGRQKRRRALEQYLLGLLLDDAWWQPR